MDKTPKNKLSLTRNCKRERSSSYETQASSGTSRATSTPIRNEADVEDSPIYLPYNQEIPDDIDVIWDWNSPQSQHKTKRRQKRLMLSQSPKLTIKRHPSYNNEQCFQKVKAELQALREEISLPDNEDCLVLSPLQEAEFKDIDLCDSFSEADNCDDAVESQPTTSKQLEEDLFNDSVDEQLFLCSQMVEKKLQQEAKLLEQTSSGLNMLRDNNNVKVSSSKTKTEIKFEDDSFDLALGAIIDSVEHPNGFKRDLVNINSKFPRTKSEVQYTTTVQINKNKMEFHRTQSFEIAAVSESTLPQSKLEEIERNRREALAKLEAKKKKDPTDNYSPFKCSPEEIEQKRRQALAKLEAKRQQDIIERKRQEAIRRLELNRKKNGSVVKRL